MNTPCGPVELASRAAESGAWDWVAFGWALGGGLLAVIVLLAVAHIGLGQDVPRSRR